MGFYADFIERATAVYVHNERAVSRMTPEQRYEHSLFGNLARVMSNSRIIKMRSEQADVFLNTPAETGQDYVRWLRLPYPSLYVQFDPPFKFVGYLGENSHADCKVGGTTTGGDRDHGTHQCTLREPLIRGAVMVEQKVTPEIAANLVLVAREGDATTRPMIEKRMGLPPTAERLIQVHFLIPLQATERQPEYFLNAHTVTLVITSDNQLVHSREGWWETRKRMVDWAVHTINFLTSPTVELVPFSPDAALQKARARRGKPPLPGWYEIQWRKRTREYNEERRTGEKAWEHSFRYDVRGHPMTFRRGRLAGRVIWCPPHQRGLKHELFKPKTYRVPQTFTGELPPGVEPWSG